MYNINLGAGTDTVTIDQKSGLENVNILPSRIDSKGQPYNPILIRPPTERGNGSYVALYDVEILKIVDKSVNLADVKQQQNFVFDKTKNAFTQVPVK